MQIFSPHLSMSSSPTSRKVLASFAIFAVLGTALPPLPFAAPHIALAQTAGSSDLALTKGGSFSVTPGGLITYTLRVTNNGPDAATNVVITDPIPSGLASQNFLPNQSPGCALGTPATQVLCSAGTLSVGEERDFQVVFQVPLTATCADTIFNAASSASSTQTDPNSSNNLSATVQTDIVCNTADLSLTKGGSFSTSPGGLVTYTLRVTNNGPSIATNVVLSDPLPSGIPSQNFFPNQSPGCSLSNPATGVNCFAGTLSVGEAREFQVVFRVPAAAVCGDTLFNEASIASADQSDLNQLNNQSATVQTDIVCDTADLSVTKGGPLTVAPGGILNYTLTAVNAGPHTATNVRITDPIPSGLLSQDFLPNQSPGCTLDTNGTQIVCNATTLAVGGDRTFTVSFRIPSTAGCADTIFNEASVASSSQNDPNLSNNRSSPVQTDILCAPPASIKITKQIKLPTEPDSAYRDADTAASALALPASGRVKVRVRLTTDSAGTFTNVSVPDVLVPGTLSSMTIDSASVTHAIYFSSIQTFLVTAPVTQASSPVFTFEMDVTAPNGGGTGFDEACIQQFTFIPANLNQTGSGFGQCNSAYVTVAPFTPTADLAIVKTGTASVLRGSTLTYTLLASNSGSATATSVVITDPIPSGLTFLPAQSSSECVQSGVNVVCSNFSLTASQNRTFTLAFTVPATAVCSSQVLNGATITSAAT